MKFNNTISLSKRNLYKRLSHALKLNKIKKRVKDNHKYKTISNNGYSHRKGMS